MAEFNLSDEIGGIRATRRTRAAALGLVLILAVVAGVRLRNEAYAATAGLHYWANIDNIWKQGSGVVDQARSSSGAWPSFGVLMQGYFERYDFVIRAHPDGNYILDYAPLRLFFSTIWVWSVGNNATAQPADLIGPLLNLNSLFELACAAMAFLLLRRVMERDEATSTHAPMVNSLWPALAAALFIWFDPALIVDAHIWPQWDIWPMPFVLLATSFAVDQRWLATGLALGLASMFKAQAFMVAPFFALWPLFQKRWQGAMEVAAGTGLGMMLIVCPWMLRTAGAGFIVLAVMAATLLLLHRVRPQRRMLICAAAGAGCLLLAGLMCGGSFGWWKIGFDYGANKYDVMAFSRVPNVPRALRSFMGWTLNANLLSLNWRAAHLHIALTTRALLAAVYVVGLVLCAWWTARLHLRKDRRLLLPLGVPWLVMFTFLPQMQGRYLVWSSILTALAIGISWRFIMPHVLVSLTGTITMAYTLLFYSPAVSSRHPHWLAGLARTCDILTPVNIALTMALLWVSWRMSARSKEMPSP